MAKSTDDSLASGLFAARYELLSLLGSGGAGEVYLAKDAMLNDSIVALKVVSDDIVHDEERKARFLREVQLTRLVTHPNVVRTFDIGCHGKKLFFTMEYVQGKSLKDVLSSGRLEVSQALEIFRQICEGLAAIHKCQIVHRDLKPANVVLTGEGLVKIADFGIARPPDSTGGRTEEMLGTVTHMAPEIWQLGNIDYHTDFYSLGVVAYELFTGVLPFSSSKIPLLMEMHLSKKPKPPNEVDKRVPLLINGMILKLLQKHPGDRPGNIAGILEVIKEAHCGIAGNWTMGGSNAPAGLSANDVRPQEPAKKSEVEDSQTITQTISRISDGPLLARLVTSVPSPFGKPLNSQKAATIKELFNKPLTTMPTSSSFGRAPVHPATSFQLKSAMKNMFTALTLILAFFFASNLLIPRLMALASMTIQSSWPALTMSIVGLLVFCMLLVSPVLLFASLVGSRRDALRHLLRFFATLLIFTSVIFCLKLVAGGSLHNAVYAVEQALRGTTDALTNLGFLRVGELITPVELSGGAWDTLGSLLFYLALILSLTYCFLRLQSAANKEFEALRPTQILGISSLVITISLGFSYLLSLLLSKCTDSICSSIQISTGPSLVALQLFELFPILLYWGLLFLSCHLMTRER